ncbi:hypothetical protein [Leuconostoc lactis]|uniref:hypothetical protein n=1 Tax=Leuconostoc lactis TaxID=1246 RepID=UPI00189A133C|nr:hypothetical protein [Leuconostoc lactis]MDI6572754.1 hypothetical protein [Leuconostoc lactis]
MIELIGIWIRKNKPWSWILILFIAVPVFIQIHWWPIYQIVVFFTPGNHDTWIQFWGSYLGIVPSGLIAYLVTRTQIDEQKKIDQQQRNREMYLNDLKKFYMLLHDMKSIINDIKTIQSDNFQIISGIPVNSDRIAKMIYNSFNETKYGLRVHTDVYIFSKSLPTDGSQDIKNKASDLSEEIESISIDVEMRVLEISKGAKRLYDDNEFKKSVLKQSESLVADYEKLKSLIQREIGKYYFLDD